MKVGGVCCEERFLRECEKETRGELRGKYNQIYIILYI